MKRVLWAFGFALFLAGAVTAVEVRLRDGTVLDASSVRITGSYVMLELADGRRVAYDVADVDVEALLAVDDEGTDAAETTDPDETLSSGRKLKSAASVGGSQTTGLAITDREVRHVSGSGVRGDDELTEEPPSGDPEAIPDGFQTGGKVLVNKIRVTALGEDEWQVSGEVVNRNQFPVRNISVRLESRPGPGEQAWHSDAEVTNYLEPGERAVFAYEFAAAKPADRTHPDVRATVIWMERETAGSQNQGQGSAPARRVGSGPPSQPTPIQ